MTRTTVQLLGSQLILIIIHVVKGFTALGEAEVWVQAKIQEKRLETPNPPLHDNPSPVFRRATATTAALQGNPQPPISPPDMSGLSRKRSLSQTLDVKKPGGSGQATAAKAFKKQACEVTRDQLSTEVDLASLRDAGSPCPTCGNPLPTEVPTEVPTEDGKATERKVGHSADEAT